MTGVFLDPPRNDEAWRDMIYDGDIIILSPTPEMLALVEHTRRMIEDAFAPLDPQRAHESLAVERCVEILSVLKPSYHSPPPYEGAHTTRPECLWLLSRKDIPGRAASALRVPQRLSYDRDRLRPPSPSRHLVFGANVSIQLVGAHIRIRPGEWNGLPSALLGPRCQEWITRF